MNEIQIIIINGLFFTIVLPLLAMKFPKTFTLLRFTTPSPIDSIFKNEYRRIMSEKQEAELVVVEQETEVVVVEEPDEKTTEKRIIDDTIAALVSTGFKKREAAEAVNRIAKSKNFDSVEDLLIAALDRSNT
jgi:hypothetical protein